jgi:hypothetical protein
MLGPRVPVLMRVVRLELPGRGSCSGPGSRVPLLVGGAVSAPPAEATTSPPSSNASSGTCQQQAGEDSSVKELPSNCVSVYVSNRDMPSRVDLLLTLYRAALQSASAARTSSCAEPACGSHKPSESSACVVVVSLNASL